MDIFISWHGKRSHAAAVALRDWLPLIVNAFKPWLSSADIDKGARWRTELSTKLGSATAGIFCLTPSNLTAPWLIFEAGAISRPPEASYVCTLLIGLQPADVKDPLAQFQATKATKEDIHQLVKNLNKALGEASMDEVLVNKAFEKWWPDLEEQLKKLPPDEDAPPPQRPEREMLQELLEKVRDISKTLQPTSPYFARLEALADILAGANRVPDMRWVLRNEAMHLGPGSENLRKIDAYLQTSGAFAEAEERQRAFMGSAAAALGGARSKKGPTEQESTAQTKPPKPTIPTDKKEKS
jgi:hypothetical protein